MKRHLIQFQFALGSDFIVSNWHLADVQTALMNVRFEGKIRRDAEVT